MSVNNREYILEKLMVTVTLGDEDASVLGFYEAILEYYLPPNRPWTLFSYLWLMIF